jgi:hypothetical protein
VKIKPRVVIPTVAALAVGGIALAAVSVQSQTVVEEGSAGKSQRPEASSGRIPAAQMENEEDPATWKLPIEFYLPAKSSKLRVSSARDTMIDACMAEAGYEAWQPAPDLPSIDGTSFTDRRYGIHDITLTSKRGYHPDLALLDAYNEAMRIGAVDMSGSDSGTLRTCVEKADGQVPNVEVDAIAQSIDNESFIASLKESSVIKAFDDWSACMKNAGFAYKTPMEALDDSRFGDSSQVTDLEISTAKADLNCRNQHKVIRTWFEAEAKIQQAKIAKQLPALSAAKARNASATSKAEAFLAQNS